MKTAIYSRRGATLAEIMVSLALVAIMITMTVSFTFLITERTKVNAAHDTMRQDCQKVQAGTEGWLTSILALDVKSISVDAEKTVTATVMEEDLETTYTLKFSYKTLTGTLPNGKKINVRTEQVTQVTFDVMNSSSDYLLFCNVTCDGAPPYTFCINPRVGENGGV